MGWWPQVVFIFFFFFINSVILVFVYLAWQKCESQMLRVQLVCFHGISVFWKFLKRLKSSRIFFLLLVRLDSITFMTNLTYMNRLLARRNASSTTLLCFLLSRNLRNDSKLTSEPLSAFASKTVNDTDKLLPFSYRFPTK